MKKLPWIAALTALAGAALTAKLVRRPRDVEWADSANDWPHAAHSRFVMVDGVRLHFQEFGLPNAPPVILVHGFCASSASWSKIAQPLAEAGYRVIAPDLVGYGFSDKPPYAEYTVHAQTRMMLRLMNRLGIGRAVLVGCSYGGAVAATCALEAPERVEKLVLVGAVSNNQAMSQPLLRFATAPGLGEALTPLMLDSRRLMHWRMKQIYAPANAHLYDHSRAEMVSRPLRSASAHRAVLHTMRRWSANHVSQGAHLIDTPTLLIWGEDDRDVPLSNAQRLFRAIPDARLIIFRHCGHVPQEEKPVLFNELLINYLRGALPYTRTEEIAEGVKIRNLPSETDEAETTAGHEL